MTWDWRYTIEILPILCRGAIYTILVTLASSAIALCLGLLLAILDRSGFVIARLFTRCLLEFFQGVPVIVLLYMGFYMLPEFGLTMPPLAIGIVVLGIVYAAYCSEVYRGTLVAIPIELRDACVALNLSRRVTWQHILIPLMIKRSAPALLNNVLDLLKATVQLFAIGLPVLMAEAQTAADQTYRYLEPLTLAGLIYLILNMPFLFVLSRWRRPQT